MYAVVPMLLQVANLVHHFQMSNVKPELDLLGWQHNHVAVVITKWKIIFLNKYKLHVIQRV